MTKGCIGMRVHSLVSRMPNGGVVLLENVRLYRGELKNAPALARILASYADLYVNDCFLTAHRTDASSVGVTKFLRPSVAGFLMQKVCHFILFSAPNIF